MKIPKVSEAKSGEYDILDKGEKGEVNAEQSSENEEQSSGCQVFRKGQGRKGGRWVAIKRQYEGSYGNRNMQCLSCFLAVIISSL